jgi:hypothetical protein
VRQITSATALAVAGILMTTNISWAGSAGRRNTALAATAVAVGAWSNGTGRAGRRNTAIVTTAGAAYAWSQYAAKKKQEKRRAQYARLAARPEPSEWYGHHRRERCEPPGRHLGWYKHGEHHGGHHGHHHGGHDD